MMKVSHMAIGGLAAYLFARGLPIADQVQFCGAALAGSVLPDFDMKLGLPHRGITHWLIWPALLWYFLPYPLVHGLALGWALHIAADCLTVSGLRPLWPLPFRIRGFLQTGSIFEFLFVLPLLVLTVKYVF
jgi:inner membrane protein